MGRRRRRSSVVFVLFAFGAIAMTTSVASAGSNQNSSSSAPGQSAPLPSTLPSISGMPVQSSTFTADPGSWGGPTPNYAFQWVRCDSTGASCTPISAATAQTYIVQASDVGATIRVAITASNKNGSTIATSDNTPVVTAASTLPATSTTTASTPTTTTTSTTTSSTPTTTTTTTSLLVSGFVLINADTNADIGPLTDGETLDLATLPTQNLNVRADTSPATVGSVLFGLDGNASFRIENSAPYALAGDSAGSYYAWTPSVGSHTLTATPYSATGATGTAGVAKTASFTVTGASPGAILFSGNWETGNTSQWSQTQCAGYGYTAPSGYTAGTVSVVSSPVAQGTFAARFDLPAAAGNNTCETVRARTLNTGSDDYYAVDLMFPSNWQEPSSAGWGMVVAQMNYENIWGSPVSLRAHSNYLRVVLMSGACVYQGTGCATVLEKDAIPVGQLTLGAWHQVIVRVHWASDSTGVVETWHRLRGDTSWVKTSTITGVPTVQWKSGSSPLSPTYATQDSFGAYRGGSSFPISIWDDGYCRAASFDAAAACLG